MGIIRSVLRCWGFSNLLVVGRVMAQVSLAGRTGRVTSLARMGGHIVVGDSRFRLWMILGVLRLAVSIVLLADAVRRIAMCVSLK